MDAWKTMKPDSEDEAEIKRLKIYIQQLEAQCRTLEADKAFMRTQFAEAEGSYKYKISRLETKVAKLEHSAPLPFDKEPYLVDGKRAKQA